MMDNCDYLLDFDFYLLVLTGAPSGHTHCYNLAAPVVTNTTT
jgi:hypothetical protein